MKQERTHKKGFALLITVSVISVLIAVSYIMFSLSLKQVTLSTAGKNSQVALYAADTGLECALFADLVQNKFFTITSTTESGGVVTINYANPSNGTVTCNGANQISYTQEATPVTINGVTYNRAIKSTYLIENIQTSGSQVACARIVVSKYIKTENNIDFLKTKIESRGYNTCSYLDPQRLERGLEVYY